MPSFFDEIDLDDGPDDEAEPRRGRRLARRLGLLTALSAAGATAAALILPVSSASADPSANDWYRLRMCESSNNYSINTGNGYYGAYQFDLSTWRSVGGSGYPNQASPAEQDKRALILYRMRGWQPWTCAGIVGLHEDRDARSGRTSDLQLPSADNGQPGTSGVPAFPGRYFHPGDHSPAIKQFQDQMHARGFFPVGTGDYGPNTLAMVKRLQSLNGLIPNGEIGPNTWRLAWTGTYTPAAPAPSQPAQPTQPAQPSGGAPAGASGAPAMPGGDQWFSFDNHSSVIKRWQDQMHSRGLFPVGTGDFGPNTLATVKRIQRANGLPETGILGPVTWKLAWTGKY